jgi:tetratricopeptide (TPR) repeat protein
MTLFQVHVDLKVLDEAIKVYREVLPLQSQSADPNCMVSVSALATALSIRFQQTGNLRDINEAIDLQKVSLAPSDPNHNRALHNLAAAFYLRHSRNSNSADLDKAIELQREALGSCDLSHPERTRYLSNLASSLHARYHKHKDPADIDEAIKFNREALVCHGALPQVDTSFKTRRIQYLHNLGNTLCTRFDLSKDHQDIEEATNLHRETLALCGQPHPDRRFCLIRLGSTLEAQFHRFRDLGALNEAIKLYRDVLDSLDASHPDYCHNLSRLACAVLSRFKKEEYENSNDLDEAIKLHTEALALRPSYHPGNLAAALRSRFVLHRNINDIERAIELYTQSGMSLSLGESLFILYIHTKDDQTLNNGISVLQEAATDSSSSMLIRAKAARIWAEVASEYGHPSSLVAYHMAIGLLPQIVGSHWNLESRLQVLTLAQSSSLSSGAATCAVKQGQYDAAVELLEGSRSVFWAQALGLRMVLNHLTTIYPDLAQEFGDLSKELENASFRDTSRNLVLDADTQQKTILLEAEGKRSRELNEKWLRKIEAIRRLPDFEDFMKPQGITALQRAAAHGPIVILVARNSTDFALIVTSSKDVQCVFLPEMSTSLAAPLVSVFQALCTCTSTSLLSNIFVMCKSAEKPTLVSELEMHLFGTKENEPNLAEVSPNTVFEGILAILWEKIVRPVLKALELKVSAIHLKNHDNIFMVLVQKTIHPTRLWWCPTGHFAFLPIHAAGIYGDGETKCVADYVISSYTPSLAALLNSPTHAASPFKMTAVIQPHAPNCSPLPGTKRELANIVARVPNQWLLTLGDRSPAIIEKVRNHLPSSSIMHFACHGVQDLAHPLHSGLLLGDGCLRVSEIMGTETLRRTRSLAFLSACETAQGDKSLPDESIHLVASLLFAGFSGVVGTMW